MASQRSWRNWRQTKEPITVHWSLRENNRGWTTGNKVQQQIITNNNNKNIGKNNSLEILHLKSQRWARLDVPRLREHHMRFQSSATVSGMSLRGFVIPAVLFRTTLHGRWNDVTTLKRRSNNVCRLGRCWVVLIKVEVSNPC